MLLLELITFLLLLGEGVYHFYMEKAKFKHGKSKIWKKQRLAWKKQNKITWKKQNKITWKKREGVYHFY